MRIKQNNDDDDDDDDDADADDDDGRQKTSRIFLEPSDLRRSTLGQGRAPWGCLARSVKCPDSKIGPDESGNSGKCVHQQYLEDHPSKWLVTIVIVSPISRVVPLQNGLFMAYEWGLLTTY